VINIMKQQLVSRVIKWLLLSVAIVFLITGFGITEYRTIESLTFGLLTKNLAFRIHEGLWIPFIILLVLHICLRLVFKKSR